MLEMANCTGVEFIKKMLPKWEKDGDSSVWNQLFSVKDPDVEFQVSNGERFKLNIVSNEYWEKVSDALDEIDKFMDEDSANADVMKRMGYQRTGLDITDVIEPKSV